MKLIRVSRFVRLMNFLSAVLAFALLVPHLASAQTDPFVGTLKLNVGKSTFSPGPPLRSATVVVAVSGQGLLAMLDGIDPQGMPIHAVYPMICDGQPHAVTGDPFGDASSCRRPDPYTLEYIALKAGREVGRGIIVVSRDGQTHTLNFRGVDPAGQPVNNVAIYDKQ
jgi:hypothetical protein